MMRRGADDDAGSTALYQSAAFRICIDGLDGGTFCPGIAHRRVQTCALGPMREASLSGASAVGAVSSSRQAQAIGPIGARHPRGRQRAAVANPPGAQPRVRADSRSRQGANSVSLRSAGTTSASACPLRTPRAVGGASGARGCRKCRSMSPPIGIPWCETPGAVRSRAPTPAEHTAPGDAIQHRETRAPLAARCSSLLLTTC